MVGLTEGIVASEHCIEGCMWSDSLVGVAQILLISTTGCDGDQESATNINI